MSKVLKVVPEKYIIRPVEGELEVLIFFELNRLILPEVGVPVVTEMWLVWEGEHAVGFAAAALDEDGDAYLSTAGLSPSCRGCGLQRKLINTRLEWARSMGCNIAYTYASRFNRASIVNLLKSGFDWYEPAENYDPEEPWEYFRYELEK